MSTPELRFVTISRPGQAYKPDDAWAVRSHVRKAVSRSKKIRPVHENLKFIDQSDRQKRRRPRTKATKVQKTPRTETTSLLTRPRHDLPAVRANGNASSGRTTSIPSLPELSHPFAVLVARHVRMQPSRLDLLFKSGKLSALVL